MRCPICKKPVSENQETASPTKWFPFCSERCKLIDLGRWLDGKYQIPVEPDDQTTGSVSSENSEDGNQGSEQ